MPNGKPGDNPLSDMTIHGAHPFPPDIEELLMRIHELGRKQGRWPLGENWPFSPREFAWERLEEMLYAPEGPGQRRGLARAAPLGNSSCIVKKVKGQCDMKIDWAQVKKKTLWHYEDLIEKILNVLDYGFVQEHYNHTMDEAAAFSERIRHGYLQHGREATFIREITEHFRTLSGLDIRNYQDLVQQVDTRAKCEVFLQETDIRFDALIEILNYLFRWVLPFKCPVKELVEADDDVSTAYLETLKKHRIRSNLDVLENCSTKESRANLVRETGIAETFILDLAHYADISRLAYVRGKTVKHLCRGGYNTIEKIANADLRQMETDMTAYYTTIGKSFSDFKAVIPLDWMIGGAKILPKVIEE